MEKGDYLTAILRSNKSIFSVSDVALLWQESNLNAIRVRLNYYARNGDLYRIRRNFYAKDKKYDRLELANRLFSPSYVSFETALARNGMIFQYSTVISLASYLTRQVTIEGQEYSYKRIKESALLAPIGLDMHDSYTLASKERALLDMLYISPGFHLDNLRELNWNQVFEILPIYQNKRLEEEVERLSQTEKSD